MSVLYDVLNMAKEKHYMVTDPVSQDPPELKASLQMLAKKKVSEGLAICLSKETGLAEYYRNWQFLKI